MPITREQQEQRLLLGHEGFYFTGGESLRVTSLNSITGVTIAGHGRFLPVSELRPTDIAFSHTPATDRSSSSSDQVMGEGWLQSLTLIASGGSPVVGSTFVRVDVVRGGGASSTVLATLVQGFVTSGSRLAWPGSPLGNPIDGPGRLRTVQGSNPAAGAEFIETVPTGARWQVLTVRAALVTDATVANRVVTFMFDDGTIDHWRTATAANQTASSSTTYIYGLGATSVNQQGIIVMSAPASPLVLPAGYRIRSNTSNLQAGDDWGAPILMIQEWLEG